MRGRMGPVPSGEFEPPRLNLDGPDGEQMGHENVASFEVRCPACGYEQEILVMLRGITTRGRVLDGADVYAIVEHKCRSRA